MKKIEQLEKEAKQARDDMREVMLDEFGIGATLSDRILSLMIRAVQSNIAHNDAKQEVSGDGSGESFPEYIEKKLLSNIMASQDYLTGDGSGKSLPEVSQEERDIDGDCHVNQYDRVDYGLGDGTGYYKNRHRS